MPALTLTDLKREINQISEEHHPLRDDAAFAAWFLRSFICDDDKDVFSALSGQNGDKNADAVVIDRKLKTVVIVQSKYRTRPEGKTEKRNDVLAFAQLARALTEETTLSQLLEDAAPKVKLLLKDARRLLLDPQARLQLFYVTTANCSEPLAREALDTVRTARRNWTFEVIAQKRVLRLLEDYLDGVAPPVPLLELEIESGQGVNLQGVLHRHDSNTGIGSWVVPIAAPTVAKMYETAGIRLFARNVRGFLGNTTINHQMRDTLRKEPEYFWYYNNGITVVCDEAQTMTDDGRAIIRLRNPQVINGQQTTRTLETLATSKATVLMRVISVPRQGARKSFDSLVSKIVAATNFQNAIKQSDLMSNDTRQIEIERALRRCGYYYLRKRTTRSEAKAHAPSTHSEIIPKETLAQAVAACDLDPGLVRSGKEQLFSEKHYEHVFPNANPYYYLARYWTLVAVSAAGRGGSNAKYLRWLSTRFVWDHLRPKLQSQSVLANFEKWAKRS
ncbi:MAG TPA: AIPR family protein, partial [Opitutaceae bacterium]